MFYIYNNLDEFKKYYDVHSPNYPVCKPGAPAKYENAHVRPEKEQFFKTIFGQKIDINFNVKGVRTYGYTSPYYGYVFSAIMHDSKQYKTAPVALQPAMPTSNVLTFGVVPYLEPASQNKLYNLVHTKLVKNDYQLIKDCFNQAFDETFNAVLNTGLKQENLNYLDIIKSELLTRLNKNSENLYKKLLDVANQKHTPATENRYILTQTGLNN